MWESPVAVLVQCCCCRPVSRLHNSFFYHSLNSVAAVYHMTIPRESKTSTVERCNGCAKVKRSSHELRLRRTEWMCRYINQQGLLALKI